MSNKINSITCTVIFDGSALNRDEKIGNNVLSIKKLTYNGDIRPYISKNAIRHYLFNTLKMANNWKEAELLQGKEVIQFDVLKDNILSSPELDAFGYMYTGDKTLTRKSPVGITKAMALSSYNQDMALYSNHDLVRRSREQGVYTQPNLFSKEEFSGLFKVSITIDAEKLGKDFFIVEDVNDNKNSLTLALVKPETVVLGNIEPESDNEDTEKVVYKFGNETLIADGNNLTVPKTLFQKNKKDISLKATPNVSFSKPEEKEGGYEFVFEKQEVVKKNKKGEKELLVTLTDTQSIPFIKVSDKNEVTLGTGKNKKPYSITIKEDNKTIFLPKELFDEKEGKVSLKRELLKPNTFFKTEISEEESDAIEDSYIFILNNPPDYDADTKQLTLKKGAAIVFPYKEKKESSLINQYCEKPFDYLTEEGNSIHIEQIRGKNKFQVTIELAFDKKKDRINEVLQSIKNGLVAQSSNELNTIKPLFILAGDVKVPMPVFHGDLDVIKEGATLKVIGVKDAIDNGWLNGNIYLQVSERLSAPNISDDRVKTDWNEFIKAVLPEDSRNESAKN